MTGRCALYLRSSKDRHDVSIDAQRRELQELAAARGLAIVAEFSDVVISGATEDRPGWQDLLRELKSPARTWRAILALDTARIARNQWIAHGLRHECKKRGVDLVFSKTPELEGIAGVILPAVLHAMDEVHSMLSREKGLAGMAENVRRGFRAGGRAPIGYKLRRIATGAIRDGAPVTKSKLEPSVDAPEIARYLKARAAGQARGPLARKLRLKISKASLVGIEQNAMTYAGATVWNGKVQPETHEALISIDQARRILAQLEARKITRIRGAQYLLSGILVAPSGERWRGNGKGLYRLGKRSVSAAALERALLEKVTADLTSEEFVQVCLARAREIARPRAREAELRGLQRQARDVEIRAARIRSIVAEMENPQGMIRELDKAEAERLELERRVADLVKAIDGDKVLLMISPDQVRAVLRDVAAGLEAGAGDRQRLKEQLRDLLERVELDPAGLTCQLHYAIAAQSRHKVASPRDADPMATNPPLLRALRALRLIPDGRQRLPRPQASPTALEALRRRAAGQGRGARGRWRRAA